ncbi:MAG: hypothetical protein KAR40_08940 [Candidatus Sabulitectum sp.]|nr:hypothetical protein [Candidatus Sabulitectum sp.]
MIQLLAAVLAVFPTSQTENWYTLLQGTYQTGCSADYLLAGEKDTGVLTKGLPLVAIGVIPDLPWPEARTVDPLKSGLWGAGRWNTSVDGRAFQDSLSISKIGLIQNTLDHSRYVFQLDRPLPWNTSGNFQILRDDSLRLFSAVMERGPFNMRTMSWEGHNCGWGSWAGWRSQHLYARAGFARLSAGDRRPEVLAGSTGNLSSVVFEIGAAASYVDSTILGRGVAGISSTVGPAQASAFFEYNDDGEGFWGGITLPAGAVELSAALSRPSGDELFQTVAVRHSNFNLVGRFLDETAVAADAEIAKGFFRGKGAACWNFDSDSLSVSTWMLLGFDWYRGRFEAGPRVAAELNTTGKWDETVDVLLGFTLASFSFATAVEDITRETERNWSFGITWVFTDQPPVTPVEETESRDGS